jgi:hypothetical protein
MVQRRGRPADALRSKRNTTQQESSLLPVEEL